MRFAKIEAMREHDEGVASCRCRPGGFPLRNPAPRDRHIRSSGRALLPSSDYLAHLANRARGLAEGKGRCEATLDHQNQKNPWFREHTLPGQAEAPILPWTARFGRMRSMKAELALA